MTMSGVNVTANEGTPTIGDIGWGLGKAPRFAGHTVVPWTVAHHSLVVMEMAKHIGAPQHVILLALLHDGHEGVTGDVPTTFKTHEFSVMQEQIDVRIRAALGVAEPTESERRAIKVLDARALVVEAYVVAPRTTYEKIRAETMSPVPTADDVMLVRHISRSYTGEEAGREVANQLYRSLRRDNPYLGLTDYDAPTIPALEGRI